MHPTIHPLAVPGARLRVSEDSLLISFDKEHLSLSTAIYGGGLRRVTAVMNQRLRTFYGEESDFPGGSVAAYLRRCIEKEGADPESASALLTAAKVYQYSHKVF